MKKLFFILILFSLVSFGQVSEDNRSSFLNIGKKAPNVHHTGDVWLNYLSRTDEDFDYNVVLATFSANSKLDWHKHATGQILIITEGRGYYQERGKELQIVQKGDVIKSGKNIEHWHASTPNSKFAYIAIYGDKPTVWLDKISEEYYTKVIE